MGQESPIEPWLAPDNRAACGLRTDWLRRGKMTKTAGRENQKRCLNRAASRDHGTEGQNNPVQWGGLDGKKNSGRRRSLFSLTPFIELIRHFSSFRHSILYSAVEPRENHNKYHPVHTVSGTYATIYVPYPLSTRWTRAMVSEGFGTQQVDSRDIRNWL